MDSSCCGERVAECVCALPIGHEIEHRCSCGGSWRQGENGNILPVTWPGTGEKATLESLPGELSRLLSMMGLD
jgi:hypothetical protein